MTYEYACEACGHQWEAEQSIKDAPIKKCVACGKDNAKRLVSGGTGFLLKGGGWYADLYSSSSKSGASSSSSESSSTGSASSGSASSGGESAAASKSDSKSDSGAKSGSSESKASKPAETKASSAPST